MAKTRAEKKAEKDLLFKARTRAKIMMDADRENRQLAIDDMRFLRVPGFQWDELTKRERGQDRPMYEFNKLNVSAKSVINQMRENRPMGKVRAAEDGDTKTADVLEGLIRNIIANADFDTVTDYAAEYQVGAGMGAWRVTCEYAEDSFSQVIDIDPLLNPFCLYCDPGAKDLLKRDAEDWWYTDRISKTAFERRWPNAEPVNLSDDTEFDDEDDWEDEDSVRIGEYWYKEYYDKELWLLSDGETISALDDEGNPVTPPAGVTVLKKRMQRCHKIKMCILSGDAILEGPVVWAGTQHPWVIVYGEYVVIDGKVHWNGITRSGKDAQRAYNYSRTAMVETVALAPQDKPWLTPKQVLGLENHLAEAHKKNFPFNLYNPDPLANNGGPPVRMGGPQIPAALVNEAQFASDDIKAVTGVYDASLGAQGNETSGRAINARKQQGEIANFNYQDNMGKGVKRTWEILVDLAPKVFDTEQQIRILGADGKESFETINKRDPVTNEVINDLGRGRFDTAITIGPSYATRRMEAAEVYTQMAGMDEGLMLSAGDLVYKALDMPYAQEIAERRQALLPAPIQELLQKGKTLPPEVTAAMAQVKQQAAQVQQHGQLVQAAEAELKELQAKVAGDAANVKVGQANIKAMEAELMAKLDAEKGELAMAQEKLTTARALLAKEVENAALKIENAKLKASQAIEQAAHHSEMEHEAAANQLGHQARDIDDKQRDVKDAVNEGAHQLKDQAVANSVANERAAHKQQMAKAKKPNGKDSRR